MHQPEDDKDVDFTSDDKTKRSMKDEASVESKRNFCGFQKNCLLSGAKKSALSSQRKRTGPEEVKANSNISFASSEDYDGYGILEFQLLGVGDVENESFKEWDSCSKPEGHDGFIPLAEFDYKHLPLHFRRDYILAYIRVVADCTVRLRVKDSTGRSRVGTAWVNYIIAIDNCFCKDCKKRGITDRKGWAIGMYSATHCIKDEQEAENTKVDFYYDSREALKMNKVKTLSGVQMLRALKTEDDCLMECGTHDEDLANRMEQACAKHQKMYKSSLRTQSPTSQEKVLVCVSHPHGIPKQVSVGKFKGQFDITPQDPKIAQILSEGGLRICIHQYDTTTCPGSSGARVICLDDFTSCDTHISSSCGCVHRGVHTENRCNYGVGYRFQSFELISPALRLLPEHYRDFMLREMKCTGAWS